MIEAAKAKQEAANNAKTFLVEFIDQAILLQATERNKDTSVSIDLSEEGARDVARIRYGFPTTYDHVCDEYRTHGWNVETKRVPKYAEGATKFVSALVLWRRSEEAAPSSP